MPRHLDLRGVDPSDHGLRPQPVTYIRTGQGTAVLVAQVLGHLGFQEWLTRGSVLLPENLICTTAPDTPVASDRPRHLSPAISPGILDMALCGRDESSQTAVQNCRHSSRHKRHRSWRTVRSANFTSGRSDASRSRSVSNASASSKGLDRSLRDVLLGAHRPAGA